MKLVYMPYLLYSPDGKAAVTSKRICKFSGRNNFLVSVEDEWPTFLLCYCHLILPPQPSHRGVNRLHLAETG